MMRTVSAAAAPHVISNAKPFIVYGTAWKKEDTALYVQQAVTAGFRFIDTACQPKHYNEKGVGDGWKAAAAQVGLQRADLFLQTKYTAYRGQDPTRVPYDSSASLEEQVKQSLRVSLTNLQEHFPDTLRVWRTMESFVESGQVHRLGIANCYDAAEFQQLYSEARIKPSVLQNRFYSDSNFDTQLREFCKAHDVWYQSFWTLSANRGALALPAVKALSESKSLSPQTLMYAFIMSWPGGYGTPLSGTTSQQHMKEDVAVMERMQSGEAIFESESELRDFAQILGMPAL